MSHERFPLNNSALEFQPSLSLPRGRVTRIDRRVINCGSFMMNDRLLARRRSGRAPLPEIYFCGTTRRRRGIRRIAFLWTIYSGGVFVSIEARHDALRIDRSRLYARVDLARIFF